MNQETPLASVACALRDPDEKNAKRAFVELIRCVHPKLEGWLRKRGIPPDDIDDALQETWKQVWQSRDRIDPIRSLQAWVFRIAINKVRDLFRNQPCEVNGVDLESLGATISISKEEQAVSPNAVLLDQLLEIIKELSESDSQILWHWAMARGGNWITDDFAQIMDMTPTALRVRLHRILNRIRSRSGLDRDG
jgi:RNA polymerase sigma factor (sigma-70 family)